MSQVSPSPITPWTDAFPKPRSDPPAISDEELAELIKTKQTGKDYIVVDVRRTDFETYAIKSAINLPAQSFYPTLPGILTILFNIPIVVFHCNSCSSAGSRGRRTAAWYQDALDDAGIKSSSAKYLEGGVKGWVQKYADQSELVVKLPLLG